MGGAVADKTLADLGGLPVLGHCWRAFRESGGIDGVIVVVRDEQQRAAIGAWLAAEAGPPHRFVEGGAERADSVRAGLAALSPATEWVAVHDAARPLVRPETIRGVLRQARAAGAAVVARPVVDTIKRVGDANPRGPVVLEDLDRSRLWAMETPQVFRRDWLEAGYAAVGAPTDDAAAVGALGHRISLVQNPHPNPKITRPEDLAWAALLLEAAPS